MSEPIIWADLTAREKTEHIVRDVMRWKYFPEWDIAHTARWALDGEVSWPYAFWNGPRDGVCVFYTYGEHAQPFNPLESMNDAWAVFLHTMEQHCPADHQWFGQDFPSFRAFVETLMGDFDCAYNDEIYPGQAIFPEIAKWTPEIICIASLRACGLEIVT